MVMMSRQLQQRQRPPPPLAAALGIPTVRPSVPTSAHDAYLYNACIHIRTPCQASLHCYSFARNIKEGL